ncbi:reverse transcriptase [Gossypium australe]|uniref:Reverse transcriptase n=1 Tax=Gossypium australe TaxID=47621 RepID=A0A5B6VHU3_9ROSI|nr:reverse transcriptase [Gossypium australe]
MERVRNMSGFINEIDIEAEGTRGDFNEIMYSFEKSGGLPRDPKRMEVFRDTLEECHLMDIGYSAKKLKCNKGEQKRRLTKELEVLLMEDRDEEILAKIIDKKIYLNMEIDKDEVYWEQRARANWLQFGDRNTAYFHKCATTRRRVNFINKLSLDDGREITDDLSLKEEAKTYFENLFSSKGAANPSKVLEGIKRSISYEMNECLQSPFREEEVRTALNGIRPTKAPGPDSFPALFFQKYWHIVGKEVLEFCLGILNGGEGVEATNMTDIMLIPKVQKPTTLVNFRPISLCTVLYKLIAKTIANRMQDVMGHCIDKTQGAFVPGRLISDNVLLAYEILHTFQLKRTGRKGYMAVKLDMSKAYDRVEWDFLKDVMIKMGFAMNWVELIMKCISTSSYAVILNGSRGRTFKPSRGLRQGDPLSPFLFLICSEGLSALMRSTKQNGLVKGARASRRGPEISHLLFADDCMLFGEVTENGARILKSILQEYERCSGQCVNFGKSTIFYSSNTNEESKLAVSTLLGVRCSSSLEKYLGLPNIVGRRKKKAFQNLVDRITIRIDGWSSRLLSQGGKEIFIKVILQAIPTYAMSVFLFPKALCEMIESKLARFWWQKGAGKRGIHWCQWKLLCRSKDEEGLGFRNMVQFNISLLTKQGWRLLNYPDSLVAQVFKAKYFPECSFLNSRLGNSRSYVWRSIWATKDTLEKGLIWKVGTGLKISITKDAWILNYGNVRLRVNMAIRRLANSSMCPRCDGAAETLNHLFRECPVSMEMWKALTNLDVSTITNIEFGEWLTVVLTSLSLTQGRIFSVTLWAIWGDRNSCVHEKMSKTGQQIASFILRYLKKLDGVRKETQKTANTKIEWSHSPGQEIKINFNGAFDKRSNFSASGVVVRDSKGRVLISSATIHKGVASAFAAEVVACHQATQIALEMNREVTII